MNSESLIITDIHASIGDTEVVKGVSLTVKPGELHVIMGQNGSGKSSFVNALMGHPKFTNVTGSLTLGDTELLHEKPHIKSRAGMFLSMQHLPAVDGITLAYFLHQAQKALTKEPKPIMDFYNDAQKIAKEAGIPESLLDRPLHAGLSGGEKKQSEVLQLLLLRPRFAFLDEIDSGVDLDALKKVWKGLDMCRGEGMGVVLITHYPSILQSIAPDRVHIMSGGTLLESGGVELMHRIEREGFGVTA